MPHRAQRRPGKEQIGDMVAAAHPIHGAEHLQHHALMRLMDVGRCHRAASGWGCICRQIAQYFRTLRSR